MAKKKKPNQKSQKTKSGASQKTAPQPPADFHPEHFINRELSWLEFNRRVLEEAQDDTTPSLERLKFLSIFSSNLDEFFMVRVAGLREQVFESGVPQDINADGMRPLAQLRRISATTRELVDAQYDCLQSKVLPALADHGLQIVSNRDVEKNKYVDQYFSRTVFPILTPLAIDPSHPRPRYHNRALYVIASLRRRSGLGPRSMFGVVQVPQVLPRVIKIPADNEKQPKERFLLLEGLIQARLSELFIGFEVVNSATFRITRDSDIDLIQQESDDMLRLVEERLRAIRRADAVRLEISADADDRLLAMIAKQEQIRHPSTVNLESATSGAADYNEVYKINGPIDLTGLGQLVELTRHPELRDPPIETLRPRGLRRHGETMLAAIRRRDILLHHPYDSFQPVVDFVRSAAEDPNVLAIKQTVYRTSGDSPIIRSLIDAAERGKHVTALVELKARFDEEANVESARRLERAGANVVYGFMDLKTHCKVSMIARLEGDAIRRYVHLSTGNYNPTTARFYTDIGLFTSDQDTVDDVSALFNLLTGYSQSHAWKNLSVAPRDLQRKVLSLIQEQTDLAASGKPSRIIAKMNSLVDPRTIRALYRASQAGVPIRLFVRGICCLRPGIQGVSENITVHSIVDRFLEHSRISVFGVDDAAKVYLASADWMPRNFHRRVEIMFPVLSGSLQRHILSEILPAYAADTVKSRQLTSDGTYVRVKPAAAGMAYRSQLELAAANLQNSKLSRANSKVGPEWE